MATNINYQINSREFFGPLANWQAIEAGRRDDNSPFFNSADWFRHTWSLNGVLVADYQFVENLLGQPFTTLDTNERLDRSISEQYTIGFIESVSGQQANLRVNGVEIVFLVQAA